MLELKANLEHLKSFVDYAHRAATSANFSKDMVKQIELVTEEAVVNIINYAYPDTDGVIRLSCTTEPGFLSMETVDSGIAFNPLEYAPQDLDSDVNSRQIGGLGIVLIKKYMDEVKYSYENGQNILTLKKSAADQQRNATGSTT